MSSQLRSKQGCWTCRLRKKKCDERHPHCSTCHSLAITCYGFGPKPDWMNDREKERAVSNSLKEIVKHTSRRKATTQSTRQRDQPTKIAPKVSVGAAEDTSVNSMSSSQTIVSPPSDHASLREDGAAVLGDGLVEQGDCPTSLDEPILLMHYLDYVFPLQYPMYKPGIMLGGRGWLLFLLLRSKPLYHAALALSAYHRRMTLVAKLSHPYQVADLVQQEQHLEKCIKLVNQFAQNSCPRSGLGITIAVLQLVFFELFTCHDNSWQAHLRAAINMYHQSLKLHFASFGLGEKSRTILYEDLPLSGYEPQVAEEVMCFRFLKSTLLWLDIISSVTTGTAPQMPADDFCVITPDSQTKLQEIMGCRNWVMLQIDRIAALNQQRTQALQKACFDSTRFDQIASEIGDEIQSNINGDALKGLDFSEQDSVATLDIIPDPTTFVTYIFAHMANIYLHLVTRGFHNLQVLDPTISEAMEKLRSRSAALRLPVLICPLYIIGCVARPQDEQFFRQVFSSAPVLNPVLKHREGILPILEEIWSRRRTTLDFEWKDALELSRNVLLF